MKPRFEILPATGERTIRLCLSGEFDIATMTRFSVEYKRASQPLAGSPHLILADFRGMNPTSAEVAAILGEVIEYLRRSIGVVCCAHLADDTITQLQTARLAAKKLSTFGRDVRCRVTRGSGAPPRRGASAARSRPCRCCARRGLTLR